MSKGGGHELNWDDPIGPAQPDPDKLANFYNIPAELRELRQWVLWRGNKEPYQANGRRASSTDPKSWTSFDKAIAAYKTGKFKGLGFVFANDYVGIDLDHMAPGGQLNQEARQILTNLDTYTEYSQSGEGLHAITRGQLPADPRRIKEDGTEQGGIKRGDYELYQNGRYFALTGDIIPGYKASIEDRPEQIRELYFKVWPIEQPKPAQPAPASSLSMTDRDIVDKARKSKIGFAFEDLYNGSTSGHQSHSEADLALCWYITFYTQDPAQVDRIFRTSGLYRPEKWDREDYRRDTIKKAIDSHNGDFYNPQAAPNTHQPPAQPSNPTPPGDDPPPDTQLGQDTPEAREAYLQSSAAHFMQGFINGIQDSVNTPYIPTGFNRLDSVLDGGLYEGLYIMGAITSLGKTSLALQIADQIAQAGQDVLIFSLEMARTELMAKSISRLTFMGCDLTNEAKTTRGITTGKRYQHYSQAEHDLIKASMKQYTDYARRIYISEGMGDIGADQIREKINQHILFTGSLPFVLVDYLQLLAPHDPRSTDKQNTDKNVLELKRISRDYKIPVLAISSFNRQNYNSPVTMEAFKESGAIEYSSDVLIGLQLSRPKGEKDKDFDIDQAKKKDPRQVELKILKNRNGRTGETLYYDYYPMFNYFDEKDGGLSWGD